MCHGLCNLGRGPSSKATVELKVNFSNCSTEMSTSNKGKVDMAITCNLQVSENCSKFSDIVTSKFKTKQIGGGAHFIFSSKSVRKVILCFHCLDYTCNGNFNTQLSTIIPTPVSTLMMENLSTPLRTSNVSNFVDTTMNRVSSLQTSGVSTSVSTMENISTTLQTSEVSNFVNTTINSSTMCTDITSEPFQDTKPSGISIFKESTFQLTNTFLDCRKK